MDDQDTLIGAFVALLSERKSSLSGEAVAEELQSADPLRRRGLAGPPTARCCPEKPRAIRASATGIDSFRTGSCRSSGEKGKRSVRRLDQCQCTIEVH